MTTNDETLADLCRQLRNHGQSGTYIHERAGANFRLDEIQAAILCVKLDFLKRFTTARQRNAARYDELLIDTNVERPFVQSHNQCVYHQYSILCDRRDELRAHLQRHGIASGVFYPLPLHRQPCFSHLGKSDKGFENANRVCERILSLPVHPMLSDDDVTEVARCVRAFYGAPVIAAPLG